MRKPLCLFTLLPWRVMETRRVGPSNREGWVLPTSFGVHGISWPCSLVLYTCAQRLFVPSDTAQLNSFLLYSSPLTHSRRTVDKLEQMLGSYAPAPDGAPLTKKFPEEESPSGMIARSGTYNVRSRVIDDDGQIYIDFEWSFKLSKEW